MMSERTRKLLLVAAGGAIGWSLSRKALGPIFGYPREWRRFTHEHRDLLRLLRELSNLSDRALGRTHTIKTVADRTVFFLGCLCWADFGETIMLAANGMGIGATKLLRSLYEHAVTAQYISKHPDEAAVFERYAHVQEHKMLHHARRMDLKNLFTPEREASINQAFEEVKAEYRQRPCPECGRPGQISWTQKDLLTMARETGDGLEKLYLQCYVDPTVHAHATPRAFMSRLVTDSANTAFVPGPQRERAAHALLFAYAVTLLALRTQDAYFALDLDRELLAHAEQFSAAFQIEIARAADNSGQ